MEYHIENREQFDTAVTAIFSEIIAHPNPEHATVVCMSGDLGAGKTTATQVIATLMGITETVTSPTFVVKKTYPIQHAHFSRLVHVDAYRLESEKILDVFDFESDFTDPGTIMIIEWPEYMQSIIPKSAVWITIQHNGESSRTITHKKTS